MSNRLRVRTPRVIVTAVVAGLLVLAPTAPAVAACEPVYIWTTSPAGAALEDTAFIKYEPDGTIAHSMVVEDLANITDIAISPDGEHLWAISLDTTLREIDQVTGAILSSDPVVGTWTGSSNALSALPDGKLISASFDGPLSQLYEIDPVTLTSRTLPSATLPPGYHTSGDFLTLDEDLLLVAVTTPGGDSALYLMDLSTNPAAGDVVGMTPEGYGASRAGDAIFLAGSDGNLYRIDGIPTTPSTSPLPTSIVASTATSGIADIAASYWGAASTEDAGRCTPSTPVIVPSATPAGPTLPATGSDGSLTLAMVASGLIAAGVALILRKRNRGRAAKKPL